MRRSRTCALLVGAALLAGCGETSTASFGQLRSPAALAVHQPSAMVFVASLGSDELKVFDALEEDFLSAPARYFSLSIPTVADPRKLAAADRFVFVMGGAAAEVGFVDTLVPAGAAGPRSVDVGGFPLTLPVDMVPTAMEAFAAAWPWDPAGVADHALVAGLDDAEGGVLLAIRPPSVDGDEIMALPQPEAVLDLPGIYPAAIALDSTPAALSGLRGPTGAPVDDCRPLAIGDGRFAPGHVPAIWLSRARVQPDGSLTLDPLDPAQRVEIRVPLTLADGTVEERVAPIRELAFAPAPVGEGTLAALAADPCALRSGRIYAVLDPVYCAGASICPDVAVVDLVGDEGPSLAPDALEGGVALYDFPTAILSVTALPGPFNLPAAYLPGFVDANGRNPRLDQLPALGLLAATNGSLYYLAGGLGPYLVGPTAADRAPVDAAFPVDAEQGPPRLAEELARTDAGLRGSIASQPSVVVPEGARPLDEQWDLGFLRPLPGLAAVGRLDQIDANGALAAPVGVSFVAPVAVRADADPRRADRVVPFTFGEAVCEGFPVIAVEAEGLVVDLEALTNDAACLEGALPLRILPPLDEPWWLSGETIGFVGRLPAGSISEVVVGSELQFAFTPGEEDPPAGAAFGFATSDGFRFYGSETNDFAELPASVEPFLASGPREARDPDWRVFIAFTGTNSLGLLFPTVPDDLDFFQ